MIERPKERACIKEVTCCVDKATNCPKVRLYDDGIVELEDDDGYTIEWTVAEATAFFCGLREALGVHEDAN